LDVLPDRLRVDGVPAFTPTDYLFTELSPFLECTEIGEIALAGGPTDDRFYPKLEKLGAIGPDRFFFAGSDGIVDVESIDGFDSVTELGGIGGEIRRVTGFNSVRSVGALGLNGTEITGLTSLEEVGELVGDIRSVAGLSALRRVGTLKFTGTGMKNADLPALEDVTHDFTLEHTAITRLSYPKLAHIGGDVLIELQDHLSDWRGFADAAHVGGHFFVTTNGPVTNKDILDWAQRSQLTVDGITIVCGNGGTGIPDPTCPKDNP
jgi:hypothetical protein